MGVYYLSAVVPGPEGSEALEKAVKLAETASEGERRFINAMVLARANGGAGFADAVPKLEALGSDYPNERLVQMILGQIHQAAGDADKARSAFERALEIGPSSSRARSFIVNDDLLQGKYSQARASFEAIEKVLPKGSAPAPIRYGVAFSYLYEGKGQGGARSARHISEGVPGQRSDADLPRGLHLELHRAYPPGERPGGRRHDGLCQRL